MIEAIRAIGEYAMRDREQFLENLCINLPATRLNNQKKEFKQYMFILNFDTARGKIVCDFEAVKDNSGRTYLWIGNNHAKSSSIKNRNNETQKCRTKKKSWTKSARSYPGSIT